MERTGWSSFTYRTAQIVRFGKKSKIFLTKEKLKERIENSIFSGIFWWFRQV